MVVKIFRLKSIKALLLIAIAVVALALLSAAPAVALPAPAGVGPRSNVGGADPPNGVYVSPTGNDSTANGSISAPYKSINTALAAAQPGDTIILRGGTYQEGRDVRVRKSNITIKSAQGEWAVIDLTNNTGNNELSAIEFYAENEITGGIVSDCKLQSVEVKGGFYAVCFETKWEWGQADRSGASNIIIEDCLLHDSTNDVVKVKPGCKNITIRYNEIYNSGREYISYSDFDTGERNSEGIDNVNGDNMHVHNNYIHDICSTGIYAKGGATDVIIENNFIERAYAGGIMVGFDTSPQYFDLTVNPLYYENIRGIVRNNLVIDVGWEGIGLYASMDAQVYNNTVINAVGYGRGLYHSPIYFGVATQDWGNPAGCPPSANPSIHHNIVIQPSTYNNRMIDIRYATGVYSFGLSALEGKPTMYDNCYYIAGKGATFTDNRPDSFLNNARLSAWQVHIDGDSGSLEVDPVLGADYVATNPPCVGRGFLGFLAPPTLHTVSGTVLYQPSPRLAKIELFNSNGTQLASVYTDENGDFTLSAAAGTGYTLVVTKPGYLSYTIKNLNFTEALVIETIDFMQLAGDINGDGFVNSEDLVCLISEFGRAPIVFPLADIDGDGYVNSIDLTCLLAGFNRWDVVVE